MDSSLGKNHVKSRCFQSQYQFKTACGFYSHFYPQYVDNL